MSYLITFKSALKSVLVLFSTISIVSLFLNLYVFTITSISLSLLIFTISIVSFRLLIHFILDRYRAYGGNIKNVAIIGFDKKGVAGKIFADHAKDNGLIVRAIGDVIAFCPPLIIKDSQINDMFDIVEHSLKKTMDDLTAQGLLK